MSLIGTSRHSAAMRNLVVIGANPAQATDAADTEKPTWQYRYRISALPTMADIDHPRIDVRFGTATRHFHCSTRKFSQSHGRPVTMTAVPVQPFSRSPGGSGGRAAAGGDVGS